MKKDTILSIIVITVTIVFFAPFAVAEKEFLIKDGDRVVIYGDSITDNHLYPQIIEDFIITRFPDWNVEVWNRGWGGDTAHYYSRFQRDCLSLKPTVAIICLGMNDACYVPFDKKRFEAYVHFLNRMAKNLKAIDAHVVFVSPPTYDIVQGPTLFHPETHKIYEMSFYPEVLREFSLGMLAVAKVNQCTYIDLNTSYSELLATGRARYGAEFRMTKAGDAVHPYGTGQLAMAAIILEGLNAPAEVSLLEIDAKTVSIINAHNADATDISYDEKELKFTRFDAALPMPIYDGTEPVDTMLNTAEKFSRNILQITGLKPGNHKLVVDGVHVYTLNATSWAKGVNLSVRMTLPENQQAKQVASATAKVHEAKYYKWRKVFCKKINWVGDGSAYDTSDIEALQKANKTISATVMQRSQIAKPKPRLYRLICVD